MEFIITLCSPWRGILYQADNIICGVDESRSVRGRKEENKLVPVVPVHSLCYNTAHHLHRVHYLEIGLQSFVKSLL